MENIILFKERLTIETDIRIPDEEKDIDDTYLPWLVNRLEEIRKELKEKNISEEQYETWKKEFLDQRYSEAKEWKWITCSYMFAGIGSYYRTLPEGQLNCFINYINSNGSAFYTGNREATEEEVKDALALHAFDKNE